MEAFITKQTSGVGDQDIAPTYFEVIKKPVDLSLMDTKLARGDYKCAQMLRDDYELMVRNAMFFNGYVSGQERWGAIEDEVPGHVHYKVVFKMVVCLCVT